MADQGHNYPTGCLCYIYFQSYYKMIEVVLSKQQALDADQKAIQQINSTGNLDWAGNTTMFFITEEAKETISGIKNGTEIALNLSPVVSGNSNDETNCPYNLSSTNTQVLTILKAF